MSQIADVFRVKWQECGKHGPRVAKMAVMAAAGALLTALAFGIGAGPWGWVVLAAFVVTLLGGRRSRSPRSPAISRPGR